MYVLVILYIFMDADDLALYCYLPVLRVIASDTPVEGSGDMPLKLKPVDLNVGEHKEVMQFISIQ